MYWRLTARGRSLRSFLLKALGGVSVLFLITAVVRGFGNSGGGRPSVNPTPLSSVSPSPVYSPPPTPTVTLAPKPANTVIQQDTLDTVRAVAARRQPETIYEEREPVVVDVPATPTIRSDEGNTYDRTRRYRTRSIETRTNPTSL